MRRVLAILVLTTAAACATVTIRLSPRYLPGDVRTYRLVATAVTTLDLPGTHRTETTRLEALSTIEVTGVAGSETLVRLTLTAQQLRRDGVRTDPPPEQRAELALGPDGSVRRVITVGGLEPSVAGVDAADLAPLLRWPLPGRRVHVGDSWQQTFPASAGTQPGYQDGRVTGLRRARGYDCAIIDLGTRRQIARARRIADQPVRLTGTEFGTSRIAFAFRAGFPVEISASAEARFAVTSGSFTGGSVTIKTRSSLTLLRAVGT